MDKMGGIRKASNGRGGIYGECDRCKKDAPRLYFIRLKSEGMDAKMNIVCEKCNDIIEELNQKYMEMQK